ncbi:MAG: ribosomal protein S18-alanine N-acetyltransferase [Gammaproteobacteria bacterium]|nr:ribosomal protein S18-alanine N-acetyltransferase [Gammaproteobacteria bacterium]
MSAELKPVPAVIRDMRQADLITVAIIEQAAYEFPWSPGIFRDCLLAGYSSVVLEHGGKIIGYGIVSVAAGEAHLLNLALSESARGMGHGRRLLEYLMELARLAGAEGMYLEVRPSNLPALALYEKHGFEVVGRRRGYYRARGGTEDAVVLVHRFHRRR